MKSNSSWIKEILENWSVLDNEEIKNSANYILDNFYKNNIWFFNIFIIFLKIIEIVEE